eukprot:SAG31_NODE_43452_length_267_cov_0.613095_2_plen_56_part_01
MNEGQSMIQTRKNVEVQGPTKLLYNEYVWESHLLNAISWRTDSHIPRLPNSRLHVL